jgi:predicted nucleic acid-binding protein
VTGWLLDTNILSELRRPKPEPFAQRILPITEDVMLRWRLMVEDGRKSGHTFSQPDLIIAAIAFHHDLTVVTRDESDYRRARVPVLNPWHDPRPTSAV